MGGWLSGQRSLGGIGPQRGPATAGRLRAQWRQVDTENREAVAVRREWMSLMGLTQQEINDACEAAFDLVLEDELEELALCSALSAKRLLCPMGNCPKGHSGRR